MNGETMSEKCREMAIEGLRRLGGDDIGRARLAFRGMTPEQMQQPFGDSGRTRAQVLADYEERGRDIEEAIAWVRQAR
jgi:hypothetical protein